MSRRVIGIDFGTTSTAVAYLEIGSMADPRSLDFGGGNKEVPTLLFLDRNDQTLIAWGRNATRALRAKDAGQLERDFKRKLGESDHNDQLCKIFLRCLKDVICKDRNIEKIAKKDFLTAVGVPAKWKKDKRDKLKTILKSVGFPDVHLLEEPVAAMHSVKRLASQNFKYGQESEHFMVIDFGGGTLDICVVKTKELGKCPEIISTLGDAELGGIEFDELLENRFLRFAEKEKPTEDAEKCELRDEIIKAKETFSKDFAGGNKSSTYTIALRDGTESFTVDRNKFENLCREKGILRKIEDYIEQALEESGSKIADISRVILTGGSSKWYFVREAAVKVFAFDSPEELFYTDLPHNDVARGLTIAFGRGDEPEGLPGTKVRARFDKGAWSEYKVLFEPNRSSRVVKEDQAFLGYLKGSAIFKVQRIVLEWVSDRPDGSIDKKSSRYSTIKFYARRNAPFISKCRNVWNHFSTDETLEAKEDKYAIYIKFSEDEHGHANYKLFVDDNRRIGLIKDGLTIMPGQDTSCGWLGFIGFGDFYSYDHKKDRDAYADRSISKPSQGKLRKMIGKVGSFRKKSPHE